MTGAHDALEERVRDAFETHPDMMGGLLAVYHMGQDEVRCSHCRHCDAKVTVMTATLRRQDEQQCPQPCAHLSQEDAREGRTCAIHPCTCADSEPENAGRALALKAEIARLKAIITANSYSLPVEWDKP